MNQNQSQNTDKEKAILIAEKELLRHYPNFETFGQKLELIEANQFKDDKNRWFIKYDTLNVEDASVEMIVDIKEEKVLSYRDKWT